MERTQLKPSPDLVAASDQEDGGASVPFRILSLDGGGYKGMFTAAILDRLAADPPQSPTEAFAPSADDATAAAPHRSGTSRYPTMMDGSAL